MARRRAYHDEEWLVARLREGCSREEIAEDCDVTEETVAKWIDRLDVQLYRDEGWLRERTEDYWTPAEIAADCAVTEETVRKWMDRFGITRPDPPSVEEMEQYLEGAYADPRDVDKKERIVALLAKYGGLARKKRVIEVVGCSADYASRFHWSDDRREVIQRHRRARESDSIPDHLRESVLDRDGSRCVFCECEGGDELELHHVIPGESTEDNLATLCRECHLDVHGGAFGDGVIYESRNEFWEEIVERDVPEEHQ